MTLKIMPHGRLQEWVAEEKGFFTAEGLDYSFIVTGDYGVSSVQRDDAGEIKSGAFETFGAGRDGADVSCACHWATSAAASERAGQLVTTAYSVAPCAIVVPPESEVRRPEDLAGVPIGVGYHSGSHFATLQALEPVLDVGVEDRAAAEGEHAAVLAQRAGRGFAFELAEGRLALLDEDVADRLARGGGDVGVGLAEAGAEAFGQQRAHRGLARAGRADEHGHGSRSGRPGHEITRAFR